MVPILPGQAQDSCKQEPRVSKLKQCPRPFLAKLSNAGGSDTATGLRYWTMTVSNLAAATQRAEEAGYAVPIPVTEIRPGTSICMIEDPDGNYVELLEVAPAPKL